MKPLTLQALSLTVLLSFPLSLSSLSAAANTAQNSSIFPTWMAFKPAPVPDSDEYPPTRGSGARPGQCRDEDLRGKAYPMTTENNIITTISPNPSISIYLPEIEYQDAVFMFLNDDRHKLYEKNLELRNSAGILTIELPEEVVVEPNAIYHWAFLIHCDPNNHELDEFISGWLYRYNVPHPHTNHPLEQAMYYQENGTWHEAFTLLLGLRETQPQAWADLLQSAKLERYIDAPQISIE